MNKTKKKIFYILGGITAIALFFAIIKCTTDKRYSKKIEEGDTTTMNLPLNLSVFVDLSDRIKKEKDGMNQAEKDQKIINGLVDDFIARQSAIGFQKSNDSFRIVFYPAPEDTYNLADSLFLDLGSIKGKPKKKSLLAFKDSRAENLKKLYDKALNTEEFFGSDIWGFFAKDKVNDLYKPGYRNVLVILSDGYIFDLNNKIKNDNNYSYILPQTLSIKDSGLIPCKISNPDMEIYFMECNANPQTDYPKMKEVLEKWFKDMGIKNVDIQDTDLPVNTLRHLQQHIFTN